MKTLPIPRTRSKSFRVFDGDSWTQVEIDRVFVNECIAYKSDGSLCRAPATCLDLQRGGMVCVAHAPERGLS